MKTNEVLIAPTIRTSGLARETTTTTKEGAVSTKFVFFLPPWRKGAVPRVAKEVAWNTPGMFRKSLWGTVNCGEGRRIWRSEDEDDESHDHAKQSRRDARSLALWGWLVRYVYVEDLDKRCMIRSEVYLESKYASAKGPSATHAETALCTSISGCQCELWARAKG